MGDSRDADEMGVRGGEEECAAWWLQGIMELCFLRIGDERGHLHLGCMTLSYSCTFSSYNFIKRLPALATFFLV